MPTQQGFHLELMTHPSLLKQRPNAHWLLDLVGFTYGLRILPRPRVRSDV